MKRRIRVTLIASFGGLFVLGGLGFAAAQEAGEVGVERPASVPASERIVRSREIQASAATLSRRVSSLLDEARQERDIIRVTCLNDKLTQINANVRSLNARVETLESATDPESAMHEYTVVTVLGQKNQTLDQEASQCIGEDLFETGAATVTTEIDPAAPTIDPALIPPGVEVSPVPFIPPPASGES